MKEERIHYIDFLRGIGIIFVVIGHLSIPEPLHNYIYSFHMPLFFFLGGLVYKKRDILYDIKKRFCSLMIPYFMWGIFYFLYYQLVAMMSGGEKRFDAHGVLGLLAGEYNTIPYNKALWFLPCFFLVTAWYNTIVTLFLRIFKKRYVMILVLVTIVFGVCSVFLQLPCSIWGAKSVFRYSFFYALGHFIRQIENSRLFSIHRTHIMLGVTIIAGAVHLFLLDQVRPTIINSLVTPTAAIVAWYSFARLTEGMLAFFEIFGIVSLDILCTEDLAANIVQNMNEHIFRGVLTTTVEVVLILSICLVYAYVIKRKLLIIHGRQKGKKRC